jgi:predicted outer membrane repeat protein
VSNTLRSFVEGAYPYDRILFDQSKFPTPNTSINLVAPLTINRPLEIVGFNAESPKITGVGQSGAGSFVVRLFNVTSTGDLRLANVSLRFGGGRPALSAGAGSGNGGIIENFGRLALSNCEISFGGTPANGSGGGLFNGTDGTAEIDRCTFTVNQAAVGGAIFNLGKLKVSRSTFAFNRATLGAAINSADTGPNSPLLTSVTIAKNTATTSGGGIRYTRSFAGSSATLQNSIVAENTAPASPDVLGDFTSLGNNLIGRFDGSIGFTNGTSADIVGSLAAPVTANLIASSGTTVNNGGQAFTLRPLPASRAINNGVALAFTTDQRGFPLSVGGVADIGAIEFNMTPIGTLEGARRRLPNSNAGTLYSQTIEAFGAPSGSAFTFTATTLPPFLTLTPSVAAPSTATLAGTPSLAQAGTYTFTITATAPAPDAFTVSNDYTLLVGATQTITNFAPASPVTLGALPVTLTATGGGSGLPVTFATTSAATICTVTANQVTFTGIGTCVLTANQAGNNVFLPATEVTASIVINAAPLPILNIDNSSPTTIYDAATDGVLLMRYLLGYRGAALIANARGTGAALRSAAEIEAHIAANIALFDVDGDGQTLALTDGVMILRRLLNPAALTTNAAAMAAITANAKRGVRTDSEVVVDIDALKP